MTTTTDFLRPATVIIADSMWTRPEVATAIAAVVAAVDTPTLDNVATVIRAVLHAAEYDSYDRELSFELAAQHFGWDYDDLHDAWLDQGRERRAQGQP
ncbi:MAG: hypothetical protein ABIQ73_12290 [Acidimicrobiales bacterium]